MSTKSPNSGNPWLRYMGLAGQFLGAIALGVFMGVWIDGKLENKVPWLSISLPILVILGMLIQIFKSTSPPKK